MAKSWHLWSHYWKTASKIGWRRLDRLRNLDGRCDAHSCRSSSCWCAKKKIEGEPKDQALGRSRGGLTTKIHLICDGAGHPLAVQVFAGHRQESVQAERLLEAVRIPRLRGCPRRRPHYLIADRAYGVDRIRCYLRRRGIKAVIPNKAIPQGRKRRKKGPRPKVDRVLYAKRNIVERLFGWLKHSRRFATRFEKKASHFLAIVKLACIKRLFKSYFSDTT